MVKRAWRQWWLIGVLCAGALVAAVVIWQLTSVGQNDGDPSSGDMPTVVRIPGGMLEVATVRHGRTFPLTRPTEIAGRKFELCPETARVDLMAYFTYRVKLEKVFEAQVRDGVLRVQAPALEPALPVAWDTKTLHKRIDKCWLMPGRDSMATLEHDISRRLEEDAKSTAYLNYARGNGARETVKEFVRAWLLQQKQYEALPADIPIEVTFAS